MPKTLKFAALAPVLLAFHPANVPAGNILEFTHSGFGSGKLAGVPFPQSDFVIKAYVNTDDRQSFSQGWLIPHTSASIWIDGLGDLAFLSPTYHFVNNLAMRVGFAPPRGMFALDQFIGPQSAEFGNWDMLGPIGPISGAGSLQAWQSFAPLLTTGGNLLFNNGDCDANFTAALVPEPSTLTLLAVAGISLCRRRRPKFA